MHTIITERIILSMFGLYMIAYILLSYRIIKYIIIVILLNPLKFVFWYYQSPQEKVMKKKIIYSNNKKIYVDISRFP